MATQELKKASEKLAKHAGILIAADPADGVWPLGKRRISPTKLAKQDGIPRAG